MEICHSPPRFLTWKKLDQWTRFTECETRGIIRKSERIIKKKKRRTSEWGPHISWCGGTTRVCTPPNPGRPLSPLIIRLPSGDVSHLLPRVVSCRCLAFGVGTPGSGRGRVQFRQTDSQTQHAAIAKTRR